MNAPCKDCGDRKIGCHGQCKKYLEYRAWCDKILQEHHERAESNVLSETKKRFIRLKVKYKGR